MYPPGLGTEPPSSSRRWNYQGVSLVRPACVYAKEMDRYVEAWSQPGAATGSGSSYALSRRIGEERAPQSGRCIWSALTSPSRSLSSVAKRQAISNRAGEANAELKTEYAATAIIVNGDHVPFATVWRYSSENRHGKRWWMRSFFCALTCGNRSFTLDPYRSLSEGLDAAAGRPLRPRSQRVSRGSDADRLRHRRHDLGYAAHGPARAAVVRPGPTARTGSTVSLPTTSPSTRIR